MTDELLTKGEALDVTAATLTELIKVAKASREKVRANPVLAGIADMELRALEDALRYVTTFGPVWAYT